jgi:predicted transcriptional regulator
MSHILTVKLPQPLLEELDAAAKQGGVSKGALVRQALESFLKAKSSFLAKIEAITRAHKRNKIPRSKVNWDDIYAATRVPQPISPEEEVRRSRRRGM